MAAPVITYDCDWPILTSVEKSNKHHMIICTTSVLWTGVITLKTLIAPDLTIHCKALRFVNCYLHLVPAV